MSDLHLLRAADHRRMAWKNGGGETLEIAVSPPDGALDGFDWRVSLATVASDGPFSAFPGIDRTLALLEGEGMELTVGDSAAVRLRAGDAPLVFAADVATQAVLVQGPIVDFNVMTRRGRYGHLVEPVAAAQDVDVAAGTTLLLLGDGLAIETGTAAITLGYRDCARIDGPAEVHIGPAPDSGALLVRIWPVG